MTETTNELRKKSQSIWKQFRRGYPPQEFLDRHISIYITKRLLRSPVTANQVTAVNMLVGLLGAALLGFGPVWFAFLGAVILRFGWAVLDCVDGEIARYRGTTGVRGQYLDRFANFLVEPYIFVALAFRVYSAVGSPAVFLLAFLAAVSTLHIKLSVYTLYISLFDEQYVGGSHIEPSGEPNGETDAAKDTALPHLLPLESRFYALAQTFLPGGFGMLWLLLAVTFLDAFVVLQALSFINLFLIAYGILLPVVVVISLVMILRKRIPEGLVEYVRRKN